jgi:hypothetical protein
VQAVIKIDECVSRPDAGLKFLASHHVASSFEQDLKDLEGLTPQPHLKAVLAQFASTDIELEIIET